MLLSFVKEGLRNLAILRKLRLICLTCSRSAENSITFGSTSHVPSPCFSEAWSAFYLVFTWPCNSLDFLSIDTYTKYYVYRMYGQCESMEVAYCVNYLIDFEIAGIYYLMVATFAGKFGFTPLPSSFCNWSLSSSRIFFQDVSLQSRRGWPCLSWLRHWFHHRYDFWSQICRSDLQRCKYLPFHMTQFLRFPIFTI
jgi:hypothetical protein